MIGAALFLQAPDYGKANSLGGPAPGKEAPYWIQAISANESAIQKAEEPKPDLITSIKISETVAPHQDVSISTTVKNIGSGPSPASFCEVIVRNARPPRQVLKKFQEKIRELDPDDSFTFSISVKPGLGLYEVCAYADAKKSVNESDETNNRSCAVIEGK
jgi:subtilase family serine protease